MSAYSTYITDAAKAIRDYLATGATDAQINDDVLAMWTFESELAKVFSVNKFIYVTNDD